MERRRLTMNLKVKEEDIRRKNLNEFKMKDLYKVKQDIDSRNTRNQSKIRITGQAKVEVH